MFKGILPSKGISSPEFTMLTPFPDSMMSSGKENHPALATATNISTPKAHRDKSHKKANGREHRTEIADTEQAFDRLLDDLQIPSTLRPRLATMESSVKAAMLKSSKVLATSKPASPKGLRRARSSESLVSLSRSQLTQREDDDDIFRPPQMSSYLLDGAFSKSSTQVNLVSNHNQGSSLDLTRDGASRGRKSSSASKSRSKSRDKDRSAKNGANASTAARFCSILTGTSSLHLDIEPVKKLRLLLRNEPASWTIDFVQRGGYSALVTRLNELLEVEWREEQHDDQVLYELLRCFKALSTSGAGCAALRSYAPTPFTQLVSLLYSDKKPGDVPPRQLIVELLLTLFELYPPSSLPSIGSPNPGNIIHSRTRSVPWELESATTSSNLITLPPPHSTFFSFIRALLLVPAPPPSENPKTPIEPHDFIEGLHVPRIYKTYLQELSDICRDYFWVFCHPSNTIWNLDEVDEGKVERPRAPGGMTGGVEFEAMSYMTTHLKLINAIAKSAEDLGLPKENELSAHRFHKDLLLSGFERILLVARKASTTYYPTLHLEIARYIKAAGRAGYDLPWSTLKAIGAPPSNLRRSASSSANTSRTSAQTGSYPANQSRPIASVLPNPRKVTPMFG